MNSRSIALVLAATAALALSSCKKEEDKQPQPMESSEAPEPAPEPTPVTPVARWVADHFGQDVQGDTGQLLYAEAKTDLDGDGTDEVLAYVGGPMMCGTGGCNLVVLKRDGEGYREVGDLTVVQLPVGVLPTKTNGWHDLAVSVAGGGMPGGIMRVPFDGKAYASNPTVSPAESVDTIGKVLIPAEPLKPVETTN